MRVAINMMCAFAVAMPLGIATAPALAQVYIDPQLGTSCSRNGLDPCGAGRTLPSFEGWHVFREHQPVYRHWRNSRDNWGRDDAHEEWCYGTYRSYRAWDNTYKPHNGPRRRCNSPYG